MYEFLNKLKKTSEKQNPDQFQRFDLNKFNIIYKIRVFKHVQCHCDV